MIVDALLIFAVVMAVVTGFRRGFLETFFSTVGYIGGGILGLSLALHFVSRIHSAANKFIIVILAIFLVAEIGRRVLGSLAKFFRARLLWSPLRFIDSLAGVVLEVVRVTIIAYLVISVILWSPWTVARHAVSQSSIYPKVSKQMPHIFEQLRDDIEKNLALTLH